MYPSCTLGSACRCRFIAEMTRVTRENGRSRDPYPPATVSLLTNPSADAKSARTIRMIDLLASRGRVHKLSFFVQNFMDASALDPERIRACSFMVMTAAGPVSMCAHNARREEFILKPLTIATHEMIEHFPTDPRRVHAAVSYRRAVARS